MISNSVSGLLLPPHQRMRQRPTRIDAQPLQFKLEALQFIQLEQLELVLIQFHELRCSFEVEHGWGERRGRALRARGEGEGGGGEGGAGGGSGGVGTRE